MAAVAMLRSVRGWALESVAGFEVAYVTSAGVATAAAAVQAPSPAKGRPYQECVGAVLEAIAAGMAYSYTDTSDSVGQVKACKKGDGVLEGLPMEP